MEEETVLKIGRIARSTERALGISLTGEVSIFIESEELDRIAAKRPNGYLAYVEEMGNILREPDFISFGTEGQILYLKGYYQNGAYSLVCLTIERKGTPQRWYFKSMGSVGKWVIPAFGKRQFVRPQNKKVSKEEGAS